jgi:molybdenum cofactor synthesis domain-containing protein
VSTAGIIIIGNEVLSGKVEEENARFLTKELRTLGVKLMRVTIIRDEIEEIASEVKHHAAAFTHVFTTGGVGGTHDDVTFVGVARAFDLPIIRNSDLERLLIEHYKDRINRHVLSMADLPEGSDLIGLGVLPYPLVRVRNVFVLPGVPSFVRAKFDVLRAMLKTTPFVLRQIFVRVGEDAIARVMTDVQNEFPDIEIGSYPRFDTDEYRVKITIEGRDGGRVQAAVARLVERLEQSWVVRMA